MLSRRPSRSRGAGRVALEERVLGFGIERRGRLVEHQQQRAIAHESARQRQLLPLAERQVDAVRPGRAQLGVEPRLQVRDDVVGAGPTDGRDHSGFVVDTNHVAKADRLARAKLETEEVLKRPGQAAAPLVRRHARQRRVVHEYAARRRLVHLREQLDQRRLAGAVLADDGHDRAGRQRQ